MLPIGTVASPPALINLFDVCDDVTRIKADLRIISCKSPKEKVQLKCPSFCDEHYSGKKVTMQFVMTL